MRRPICAFAAVLVAAVTGCDRTVYVMEPVSQQIYNVAHYQEAAENGVIRTRVYGNPFTGPDDAFHARILAYMKGADGVYGVTFSPDPKPPGSGPYHVVVAMGATPGTDPHWICGKSPEIATVKSEGRLTMLAAFCLYDTMLSTADGVVSGVEGPDDPIVRRLVRQVTLALFPAYDHYDIGSDYGSTD